MAHAEKFDFPLHASKHDGIQEFWRECWQSEYSFAVLAAITVIVLGIAMALLSPPTVTHTDRSNFSGFRLENMGPAYKE